MIPTEPWQTRPKERGRGNERIGERPALNKRNSTEVESIGGGWEHHQHVGGCHHH